MKHLFDHEELRVYQAAIRFCAVRKSISPQDFTAGKSLLANIVRMLVAWERVLPARQ